jgi:hypothetical protein
MHNDSQGLDLRTATIRDIEKAMRRGVIAALRNHKRKGVEAVIWDRVTGEIVIVPPEEIPDFPDEEPEDSGPGEDPAQGTDGRDRRI